ncbi:BON domain-containing protein [bacterium]|nr:BON domain-containing protein [bacterium]
MAKPTENTARSSSGGGLKEFFVGLLTGVLLTLCTGWYLFVARRQSAVRDAQVRVAQSIEQAATTLAARLDTFELRGSDVREDLQRTGQVVRRKARALGAAVADGTVDTRITGIIKAKLLADRELSAWNISVTTADGRVTLAGTVSTHDQIGRAVLTALETDGVREVMSTLQVKP